MWLDAHLTIERTKTVFEVISVSKKPRTTKPDSTGKVSFSSLVGLYERFSCVKQSANGDSTFDWPRSRLECEWPAPRSSLSLLGWWNFLCLPLASPQFSRFIRINYQKFLFNVATFREFLRTSFRFYSRSGESLFWEKTKWEKVIKNSTRRFIHLRAGAEWAI